MTYDRVSQVGAYVEISAEQLRISQVGAYVETVDRQLRAEQVGAYIEILQGEPLLGKSQVIIID